MSMSLINRSMVFAALLIGISGARAFAQDAVDVKVPFDFVVNGRAFHAGTYEVKLNAGDGVVSLHGDHNKAFAFLLTTPAAGHDPAGVQPALVFKHRENGYVLSQIWESGSQGREVTTK